MSLKDGNSSEPLAPPTGEGAASIDRLTPVLERFRVQASLFHSGPLCGHQVFDAKPGRGFLHGLRRGEMALLHGLQEIFLWSAVIMTASILIHLVLKREPLRTRQPTDSAVAAAAH